MVSTLEAVLVMAIFIVVAFVIGRAEGRKHDPEIASLNENIDRERRRCEETYAHKYRLPKAVVIWPTPDGVTPSSEGHIVLASTKDVRDSNETVIATMRASGRAAMDLGSHLGLLYDPVLRTWSKAPKGKR